MEKLLNNDHILKKTKQSNKPRQRDTIKPQVKPIRFEKVPIHNEHKEKRNKELKQFAKTMTKGNKDNDETTNIQNIQELNPRQVFIRERENDGDIDENDFEKFKSFATEYRQQLKSNKPIDDKELYRSFLSKHDPKRGSKWFNDEQYKQGHEFGKNEGQEEGKEFQKQEMYKEMKEIVQEEYNAYINNWADEEDPEFKLCFNDIITILKGIEEMDKDTTEKKDTVFKLLKKYPKNSKIGHRLHNYYNTY